MVWPLLSIFSLICICIILYDLHLTTIQSAAIRRYYWRVIIIEKSLFKFWAEVINLDCNVCGKPMEPTGIKVIPLAALNLLIELRILRLTSIHLISLRRPRGKNTPDKSPNLISVLCKNKFPEFELSIKPWPTCTRTFPDAWNVPFPCLKL